MRLSRDPDPPRPVRLRDPVRLRGHRLDGGPRRTAACPAGGGGLVSAASTGCRLPVGGGWCYFDGPHVHDYFPEPLDWYAFDDGFFFWRGPVAFTYVGGHPMPGGGWCFIDVPHRHDYVPPYGGGFTWRGTGWIYGGPWSPSRPPPPTWWNYAPPRPPPPRAIRAPPSSAYRAPPPPMRVPVAPPRPIASAAFERGQGTGVRTRQGPARDHDQGHGQARGGNASSCRHAAAGGAIPAARQVARATEREACCTAPWKGTGAAARPAAAWAARDTRHARHTGTPGTPATPATPRLPRLPRHRGRSRVPRPSPPPALPRRPARSPPGCPARQEGLQRRRKDQKKETSTSKSRERKDPEP